MQAAQSRCDAAEERRSASVAVYAEKKREEKERIQILKAAQKSVKAFTTEIHDAHGLRDAAKSQLEQFKEGALFAFRDLRDRVPEPVLLVSEAKVARNAGEANNADEGIALDAEETEREESTPLVEM